MFGTEKIPAIEKRIAEAQRQIEAMTARLRGLVGLGRKSAGELDSFFAPKLAVTAEKIEQLRNESAPERLAGWGAAAWEGWSPAVWNPEDDIGGQTVPATVRMGDWVETRSERASSLRIPAMTPFIGQNQTIIIKTTAAEYEKGLALLQSLVIRSALMLPHQTTYYLLDPAGNGAAFPMRPHLPLVRANSGDVRRDLDSVIQTIQRVNENFLDMSTPSFELVDPQIRINERFQFVFAADFPNKYDRRAIEALQSVANTGPRTGTYVFIHHNTENEMPRDLSIEEFKNAVVIDLSKRSSYTACSLVLEADGTPDSALQDSLFNKLRLAKPPERKVNWKTIIPPEEAWWQESASEIIHTPVGIRGAKDALDVWFGMREGRVCAHGMLGAMTGSGKSNLYHILILGLCTRYSPNELRLFLIDGKDGVEFQPYRDLPHAEVVSLKSSPQLSRSVLAELTAEKERRNLLFSSVGVGDFQSYRAAGQPKGNLPRILLLIDEYQELFEGDKEGEASTLLLQLAQQGRSAGIHMLLGSQRFGAVGMLNQAAIFGNVHLRMAMQMTNSDIQALNEFGRRGKQLIMTCDLPGKIVVNDQSGDDSGNKAGKVAFINGQQRRTLIQHLIERAEATRPPKDVPVTIIFDGKAQPNLIENPYVSYLSRQPHWLSASEFAEMARRPVYDEGLEIIDWFAAEHPKAVWLGQEFAVRGEATLVFRRRVAENALVIGSANAVRYGMLAAIQSGLALNSPPEQIKFVIWDRSIPETAWSNTLRKVCESLLEPAGFDVRFYCESKDAETMLDLLLDEMTRRREMGEVELTKEPTVFVTMTELERVDELRRRADMYTMGESPLGEKLNRLLIEAPSVGIHFILSFSGVRPMTHVVDERRGLLNFRHRVALQMSEDESLTFVRSRKAAQLQADGSVPICALYMDVEHDRMTRFKPYTIESTIDFSEQLQTIGKQLNEWRAKYEHG